MILLFLQTTYPFCEKITTSFENHLTHIYILNTHSFAAKSGKALQDLLKILQKYKLGFLLLFAGALIITSRFPFSYSTGRTGHRIVSTIGRCHLNNKPVPFAKEHRQFQDTVKFWL